MPTGNYGYVVVIALFLLVVCVIFGDLILDFLKEKLRIGRKPTKKEEDLEYLLMAARSNTITPNEARSLVDNPAFISFLDYQIDDVEEAAKAFRPGGMRPMPAMPEYDEEPEVPRSLFNTGPKFGEVYKKIKLGEDDEEFMFDTNEVRFLREVPHFCPRHMMQLVMTYGDDMHFACKNTAMVENSDEEYVEHPCSMTRRIDRKEFWTGEKKPQEEYVDPDWLQNYVNHMFNQNMEAFRRAAEMPATLYMTPEPQAPVFYYGGDVCAHIGPFGQKCNRLPGHLEDKYNSKFRNAHLHGYAGNYWDKEGKVQRWPSQ